MKEVSPLLADTAIRLYERLLAGSKQEVLEQGTFTVFRGSLLHEFSQVSETRQYYTPCFTLLKITNCISVLDRGGRATGSVVVLHGSPDREEMLRIDAALLTGTAGDARLMVDAQVKDLLKRFQGIDVPNALDNHENRIKALELKITQITQGENNNV
jgi:hypothetical protein